jgi:uncharacterized protein (TIGR00730 family)
MHERKAMIAELADVFITLPGGVGTLEEFFETWTWAQLGVHRKPIGLLDVSGYWAPLLALLEHVEAEGFLRGNPREWLVVSDDASSMLTELQQFQAPAVRRWSRLGES